MDFKKRLEELKSFAGTFDAAHDGAVLCYETLKTSKIMLDDLMAGKYDTKDLLDLYTKLIGCEIEVSLKNLQSKMTPSTSHAEELQLLKVRKKLNNLS